MSHDIEEEERTFSTFDELRDVLYKNPGSRERVALTLSELRMELGITQTDLADSIGTTQSAVSRLERQGDVLLSTLRSYVEATGGSLRLVVRYGDHDYDIQV